MAIYGSNLSQDEQNEALRELGERLKNVREAQNLSISEISVTTKIQSRYLKAIESGDLSQLPKGPYVRGFIRQYCEFLSAPDLWSAYDVLTDTTQQNQEQMALEQEQSYTASPTVFKATSHWWIYLVIILSLATAGWITWNYRGEITGISTNPNEGGSAAVSREKPGEAETSADAAVSADQGTETNLGWMDGKNEANAAVSAGHRAAPETVPAVQAPPAAPVTAAPTDQTAAPAEKNVLRVVARGNCWMRVSSGEQTLYSGTLRPGDSKTFTVTDGSIRVKFGNPSGVSVAWNGKITNPLGPGTKPITLMYRKDGGVSEVK